jgi:hypothetical protein
MSKPVTNAFATNPINCFIGRPFLWRDPRSKIRKVTSAIRPGSTSVKTSGIRCSSSLDPSPFFRRGRLNCSWSPSRKFLPTGGYQSPGIDETHLRRLALEPRYLGHREEVPHCGRRRSTRDSVQAPLMTAAQFADLADCVAGISNSFCERLLRDEARSSNRRCRLGPSKYDHFGR